MRELFGILLRLVAAVMVLVCVAVACYSASQGVYDKATFFLVCGMSWSKLAK